MNYIDKSEKMKTVINYSVSMVLIFGTTFIKKIQLMCHMLVIKLCTKKYLKSNIILIE